MNPNLYLLLTLGGIVLLALLTFIYGFVKLIKRIRRPKARPLTPEERYEASRLDTLKSQVKAAQDKITQLEQSRISLERTVGNRQQELQLIQEKIVCEQERLSEAKAAREAATRPCEECGAQMINNVCSGCGKRQKAEVIGYAKTPWEEVYKYLHSITEWGEPSDFELDPSTFLLPWPQVDTVRFTVGGIDYEWGTMDDESNGSPDWWAYLEYQHPILGSITLINLINNDGDHLLRDGVSDDKELSGGDYSDFRSDYAKAAKQSLTALYLWLKNEEVT